MENGDSNKSVKNKTNGLPTGPMKEITTSALSWLDHITTIDISNKKIITLEDNVTFPPNLVEINLSHNKLVDVPVVVRNITKLKSLDISFNELKYFDDTPSFYNTIEDLNLSNNQLSGPPYWVWAKSSDKLINLDLSFNLNLTNSFVGGYYEELLQYRTSVVNVKINNCGLSKHLQLLITFPKAKNIQLGSEIITNLSVNKAIEAPCIGLESCCDIQSLNLSNTHVYNVKKSIDIFKRLVEINLAQNCISDLPREFCNLQNLETCILSHNSLLYLPDNIGQLQKLVALRIDHNELCVLPNSIKELKKLKCLDVYNNCLYEIPEEMQYVPEVDYAQNYLDEPNDDEYIKKRDKLRLNTSERFNGRKTERELPDSGQSPDTSDDESYLHSISNNSYSGTQNYDLSSSPEDWDSDDYWVPRFSRLEKKTPRTKWLDFVKKKMDEGNFCPMDAHIVSIADKVKYEKLCSPKIQEEVDGQFDDLSEDDS